MRRPLLFLCMCLFVLIALGMQIINPPPWNSSVTVSEGDTVFLIGQVYKKEYRVSYGEELLVLHLQSIQYSKETDVSFHELKQSKNQLSNNNPIENVICEINMNELPKLAGERYLPRLGEEIFLKGEWGVFAHATNPGEFDLANYYAIEGIEGSLEKVEILAAGERYWKWREFLFQCRQKLLKNLYTAFSQKEASILGKMLLGDGSGLDKEIKELYQENGIVHILSISGLHISMIGMGIYKLLRRFSCPISVAALLGGCFIVLYGMMTGFSVSAGRAIGMYLIHMIGEIWGKTYDMLTAMGVLAIVLLVDNPKLVYHSGYLLSFASVCGVGLLAPILKPDGQWLRGRPYDKNWLKWFKKRLSKLLGGLAVSLAVTLFTLPIQLFFFYKVPVYSVFLNLLVIPFMSLVMVLGFIVMLFPGLSFLCPIESFIFGWFEWLCNTFEAFPGHTWVTGRPQMWKILVYYVVLLGMIVLGKRLKKWMVLGIMSVLILILGSSPQKKLQITFLDVGQGDCICVQTAEGNCYLFDGGSSSKYNVGEKIILPFLQYYGIEYVDGIFVSHPDQDHINGLLQLLESDAVSVGCIYLPKVGDVQTEFAEIMEASQGITIQYVSKGDYLKTKELELTCLHPIEGYEAESNAYSACYLLETGEMSVLLTGDVEREGEIALTNELFKRRITQVEVLKVAHHGSRNSTSQEFLDVLDTEIAVISCGEKNFYGHPHTETLDRLRKDGAMIFTTPEYGAITIEAGQEIRVMKWTNQ